jgi:hypothetical protein
MALKTKTAPQQELQTKFDSHIEAQVVFKDITKSQEERMEALEYLTETQSVSHLLKLINSAYPTLHHNKLRTKIPKSFFMIPNLSTNL